MLGNHRDDHRIKFRALGFVDGNGIGEFQLAYLLALPPSSLPIPLAVFNLAIIR